MRFRSTLIKILQATLTSDPEPEQPDKDEEDETTGMYIVGPNGPVRVPDGVHPIDFIQQMQREQRQRQVATQPQQPRIKTLRNGPSGTLFDMKTVDCVEMAVPYEDPEVRALLTAGWEPFGVHKFSLRAGPPGVRMYFRRTLHS